MRAAVAAGGSAALAACLGGAEEGDGGLDVPSGGEPDDLPSRQHAWNDRLSTDDAGNVRPPTHHVFLGLSLGREPTPDARAAVADALRAVERRLAWGPEGVLFTLGYTPAYFARFDEPLDPSVQLPDPEPILALTVEESVTLETDDALLHIASDDGAAVLAVEEALFGERERLNGARFDHSLPPVLEPTTRRTGFVGPGMPAERQSGLGGIPSSEPVPDEAPFFMGFRSGFRESQATEDRVTIESGPFAAGTTQHVETVDLDLEIWYEEHTHEERVARMFSPAHAEQGAVGDVGEALGSETGAAAVADDAGTHAREAGTVGHAQKVARARDDGEPVLLRRDVNTTDGNAAGLHFVSLQRDLAEFVRARRAMLGTEFAEAGLGPRQPNGILQYMRVRRWGSYLVPPRSRRALPRPTPSG